MNTREIASEYRLTHWAQIMGDRKESGLSIKAYCEKAGFHENVYYYWQRKLREAACERMGGYQGEAVGGTSLTAWGFAEVRVAEHDTRAGLPETSRPGQIHAEVRGIRISADSAYPPDKLAELLRELLRSC